MKGAALAFFLPCWALDQNGEQKPASANDDNNSLTSIKLTSFPSSLSYLLPKKGALKMMGKRGL